jgi:superfamily I DNA and RNA helicase
MLAHAMGFGLHRPDGCIQMFGSQDTWEALGYVIDSGQLTEGHEVTITRRPEHSPSPVIDIYKGDQQVIRVETFSDRVTELNWIADSICRDIKLEKVSPEHIVAICLDAPRMRELLPPLQKLLAERNVLSTIPGIVDASAAFAEPGRVTLSTIFRAKGNESYIVYIFSFDALYDDYVEELKNRNRVFTAISRSKAWVRITGVGDGMIKAKVEIDKILADLPSFHFNFPNLDSIKNLDVETHRRSIELQKVKSSVDGLIDADKKALEALASSDPYLFEKLTARILEAKKREN